MEEVNKLVPLLMFSLVVASLFLFPITNLRGEQIIVNEDYMIHSSRFPGVVIFGEPIYSGTLWEKLTRGLPIRRW